MNYKINRILLLPLISLLFSSTDFLQPYILAGETGKDVQTTLSMIKRSFFMNDQIQIIGEYSASGAGENYILVLSNSDLDIASLKGKYSSVYASVIRLAVFNKENQTYVAYQNPEYWGNLYFQSEYLMVEKHFLSFESKLRKSLPQMRGTFYRQFGSNQKFTSDKLHHYHYMFGMEYLEDSVLLGEFDSYEDAVNTIDKNLQLSSSCIKVFEKQIHGKNNKLYGIGLSGEKGEPHFMPIIDINSPSHLAWLPYEVLVVENKVQMLHGRFRIAASFPDLTMMTFGKIMSTPSDIESQLKRLIQ